MAAMPPLEAPVETPNETAVEPSAAPLPPIADGAVFTRRLRTATYCLVLVVLSIHLLKELRDILQPLFIAVFVSFLMDPLHRWLMRRGLHSILAYVAIMVLVLLGVSAFAWMVYANFSEMADTEKLLKYEGRLDTMIRDVAARLPFETSLPEEKFLRQIQLSPERLSAAIDAGLSQLRNSTAWVTLTLLYTLFFLAERVSIAHRIALAFGEQHGSRIMSIIESISQAISQYIVVKTLVSALAGFLSYAVLTVFDVELAATWGILIFLLNYIPYLGSLIAVALPILLSFLQFEEPWKPIVIATFLIAIQQGIGSWIEPRMAGQRLDVSPLLIVLSLAFWFFVWGIVGAILAVPLLVMVRIVLDNIPETKPIATLISNR